MQFFTLDNTRVVRNDYTVQLNNIVYQLSKKSVVNARSKVVIKQNVIDGSLTIWADNTQLDYKIIEDYIRPPKDEPKVKINSDATRKSYIQPKDHPFRQYRPEKTNPGQSSSTQLELLGIYYG